MSLLLIFSLTVLPSVIAAALAAVIAAFILWGIVEIDLRIFRKVARIQ